MHHFEYRDGELYCEDLPLARLAQEVGTPAYVYSHATLERHFKAFDGAFADLPHITCYSVKANGNIALLRMFANMGGGVDIVSGGELFRALKAGVPADKIVYSGVGKTEEEMKAALDAGILMFNVESIQELDVLSRVATQAGKVAPISLRVNPDVDAKTHPYISTGLKKNKFGVPIDLALEEYKRAAGMPGLEVVGLDCHIGSQLTEVAPFVDAAGRLRALLDRLQASGVTIKYIDLGGGLGITYNEEEPPPPAEYARALADALAGLDVTLILEPGRVVVGNAGILLIKVLFTKEGETKNFVITDGAMNDLVRPTLYQSFHAIQPVRKVTGVETQVVDVVGPICETGDFLARERALPVVKSGDLLAVMSAGAYGITMSSNYNARRRAPEVLVKGSDCYVIRERESHEDLVRGESVPAFLSGGML